MSSTRSDVVHGPIQTEARRAAEATPVVRDGNGAEVRAHATTRRRRRRKADPLSGFTFCWFAIILCGLAFLAATRAAQEAWGPGQVSAIWALIALGVLSAGGLTLRATAFAAVALLPDFDHNFIPVGSVSISLVEIFMGLFVAVFIARPRRLQLTRFAALLGGIFLACLASLVGSVMGLYTMGVLLRFGLGLTFVAILASLPPEEALFKPVFYGLLLTPLVAIASYAGEGILSTMVTANLLDWKRVVYSFQYPIWLAFMVPCALLVRAPRVVVVATALFAFYLIVFSYARSIIVGTVAAGALFLFCYRSRQATGRVLMKTALLSVIAVVLTVAATTLNYLDFTSTPSSDDGSRVSTSLSNEARYERVRIAVKTIADHPLLGAGFGASAATAITEQKGVTFFDERITPEFGPLTILAEIGLAGAILFSAVLYLSVGASVKCLRDTRIPLHYKVTVLIVFFGFTSSFVNSNSLTSALVYIFLATPLMLVRHTRFVARAARHGIVLPASDWSFRARTGRFPRPT